jgi:hypothetical protein
LVFGLGTYVGRKNASNANALWMRSSSFIGSAFASTSASSTTVASNLFSLSFAWYSSWLCGLKVCPFSAFFLRYANIFKRCFSFFLPELRLLEPRHLDVRLERSEACVSTSSRSSPEERVAPPSTDALSASSSWIFFLFCM